MREFKTSPQHRNRSKKYYETHKSEISKKNKIRYKKRTADPDYRAKYNEASRIWMQRKRHGIARNNIIKKECELCHGINPYRIDKNHPDETYNWKSDKLVIHHINGEGAVVNHAWQKPDNSPENLITLCKSCHMRLHNAARLFTFDGPLLRQLIAGLLPFSSIDPPNNRR